MDTICSTTRLTISETEALLAEFSDLFECVHASSGVFNKSMCAVFFIPKLRMIEDGMRYEFVGGYIQFAEDSESLKLSIGCCDMAHPHTGGSTLCEGGWRNELRKWMDRRNWTMLANIAIASLTHYNPGSPMVYLDNYSRWCLDCGYPMILSQSGECFFCNHDVDLSASIDDGGRIHGRFSFAARTVGIHSD